MDGDVDSSGVEQDQSAEQDRSRELDQELDQDHDGDQYQNQYQDQYQGGFDLDQDLEDGDVEEPSSIQYYRPVHEMDQQGFTHGYVNPDEAIADIDIASVASDCDQDINLYSPEGTP